MMMDIVLISILIFVVSVRVAPRLYPYEGQSRHVSQCKRDPLEAIHGGAE